MKKLPCLPALQLATEMARYLGSTIFAAVIEARDESTDPVALAQFLLNDGLAGLPPHIAQDLVLRTMASVYPSGSNDSLGTESRFHEAFPTVDHLADALEVWQWACAENFRGFLAAVLSRISSRREATATAQSSDSATTIAVSTHT